MVAYKVVRPRNGKLCSAMISAHLGEPEVEYKVNEFVMAPKRMREHNLHLLVFGELKHAKKFTRMARIFEIWEVEVDELLSPPKEVPEEFSKEFNEENKVHWDWPIGTFMAKKVKLVKKLDF